MIYMVMEWVMNQCTITIVDGDAKASAELTFFQARELRDALASLSSYEIDDKGALLHWSPNDSVLMVQDLFYVVPREVVFQFVKSIDDQNTLSTKPDEI